MRFWQRGWARKSAITLAVVFRAQLKPEETCSKAEPDSCWAAAPSSDTSVPFTARCAAAPLKPSG
jgi:hypothetical protein